MIEIKHLSDPTPALPVLRELRAGIDEALFHERLKLARAQGYRLVAAYDGDIVVGVMGYRFTHDLFWGKTLFVDDLVASETRRGQGIGGLLISTAKEVAQAQDCDHIRLCSGLTRHDAHRFYEVHGMKGFSKQFALAIKAA